MGKHLEKVNSASAVFTRKAHGDGYTCDSCGCEQELTTRVEKRIGQFEWMCWFCYHSTGSRNEPLTKAIGVQLMWALVRLIQKM